MTHQNFLFKVEILERLIENNVFTSYYVTVSHSMNFHLNKESVYNTLRLVPRGKMIKCSIIIRDNSIILYITGSQKT